MKNSVHPLYRNLAFPALASWFDHALDNTLSKETVLNQMPALMNVKEVENSFVIEIAAPGMKKDNITLEVENGVLKISGKNTQESSQNEEKFTKREFSFTSFQRSVKLGERIDTDNITASLEDGILSVKLPKKEEVKPAAKQIVIA